ncbi:hypothetical protein [Bacillus wiedmannii]|uniref:hypothetical protein n=1 Tax=Bacillus wiedmannii TaxID=1890302 RepID=UPI000BF246EA|nr:hypothetical protein [Bacillus wiedmannii]PEM10726.1 hypothetical protein CN610_12430 [Bacillus wiedmannii]
MSNESKGVINKKTTSKKLDVGLILLWIFLISAILSPFVGFRLIKGNIMDFEDLGTYGDFLGGSTIPFLTVVTILFIYRTYNLQQEQLKTQQRELSLLQKEMESTKETLQEQSKTAKMQRFENSFFIQINELRKFKEEAPVTLKHIFGDATFNEWMEFIKQNIDRSMSQYMQDSFIKLPSENDKEEYFRSYGKLLYSAIDNSGIYENEDISLFFNIVNRNMQLIYEYKNSMDNWEVDFYLKYLSDEIGKKSINIILFDICINKEMIEIASALKFDRFANNYYPNATRRDFHFIEYILNENPNLKII